MATGLLTADLGRRDDDGDFWYSVHADDIISSAGYRVFSRLPRWPGRDRRGAAAPSGSVAACLGTAIGMLDPVRTRGPSLSECSAKAIGRAKRWRTISALVKTRLARHEQPRAIEFVAGLPTTTTGKIMRRVLRERELAKTRAAI